MNTLKFKILLSTVCFIITSSLFAFSSINEKITNNVATIPQSERDALIALYNATGGANWTNTTQGKGVWPINDPNAAVTSWNATTNTGWYGVTVTNGHVTHLGLWSNNLEGEIPNEIGDFIGLTNLLLGVNKLSGNIPSSIGNLINLKTLQISDTFISGTIPTSIGNLSNLINLYLSSNQLTGSIPNIFNNMPNLIRLWLRRNKLSGNIPSSIGNLSSLQDLSLYQNELSGILPVSLKNLTNLKSFAIHTNRFKFIDFEEIYNHYKVNIPTVAMSYAPQAKTDTPLNINGSIGNSYVLKMYENNIYTVSETYQWYKNNQPINGETSRTLTLSNVSLSDEGIYHCISKHPDITKTLTPPNYALELVLRREPITLSVINCPPPPTGKIITSKSNYCTGENVLFSFQFDTAPSTTFSYNWSYVDGSTQTSQINTPTFAFNNPGLYYIYLVLTDANGCESNFSKQIVIEDCTSCLHTNNQSNNVKSLFVDLVNHLKSLSSVPNGYNCPELVALSPYITDPNPRIYNFTISNSLMKFSFADHGMQNDVQTTLLSNQILQDIFLTNYVLPNINSNYYTEYINGYIESPDRNYVNHIDFCPATPCSTPINGTVVASNNAMSKSTTKNDTAKLPVIEACVNQATLFTFQTTSTNLTYNWEFKDSNGNVIQTSNVAQPSVVFQNVGYYRISLNVSDANGCTNSFAYGLNIVDCNPVSCTENNPNSQVVKNAFIALVNYLIMQPTASTPFTCTQLDDLAPYITDPNPMIYNFSNSGLYIRFSFSDHSNDFDIRIPYNNSNNTVTDIEIGSYSDSETKMNIITHLSDGFIDTSKGYIKHINFCPTDTIRCERHIAIVVDESGSISEIEARKIRSQLRSFVNKQLDDNNDVSLNTDVRISLIGLSDSDSDTRTNASIPNNGNNVILNERISSNNIAQYIAWIDGYRKKYEVTPGDPNTEHRYRVSPNSDYWNSGLTKAADLNPDFVILITDGCQTALPSTDAGSLLKTMQRFNNNNGATTGSAGKPHLFVVGIEDGFYVDSDIATSKARTLSPDEDPNFNSELSKTASATAKVSSFLRTSLKYLMAYPSSQFPIMDKYYFLDDYYGADDFNFLYDEPNYLSNGLIARSFSVNNGETTLVDPVGMSCGAIIPLEGCNDCLNFKPEIGKKYIVSAWVKEEINKQVMSYTNPTIQVNYLDGAKISIGTEDCITSGDIIDGWQRIFKQISIPGNTAYIEIALVNNSQSIPVYFDDVRIHPIDGSMKSFVYDPETFRLMSELDENNYSTFYEYDNEGGLVRVKKETSRGIKTIQETRSGNVIKAE
ncbi:MULTISPECIES: PKD domain-containing protein [Flavobacterium]|uniref:PKD domain-containing protein n=1 Tax=Flavobacterium jumunjinense TaxID=998845 RepID=A0ABV5GJP8_9FLAO|nr:MULTISPECIES: PKD domain-containing protein [Flavobacterium]